MLHINSEYVSGLLKPCTRLATPLSSIIVKTDDYFLITRKYFNSPYLPSDNKNFFVLGFKPLAQWVN